MALKNTRSSALKGIICLWSGAIVDIPAGWQLCDGSNGSPDLRDKFVVGAGSTYNPGNSGGTVSHQHSFTSDVHDHSIAAGSPLGGGAAFNDFTDSVAVTGTTDSGSSLPPYYALAYIIKI